tara:strand:+ start:201 stop:401 length:201 start_codon:yes stop_codon:yes gene_type:complete
MTKEQQVQQVINILNSIDVDGETMEHILEEVGMTSQMLRQLTLGANDDDISYLCDERKELQRLNII